MEKLYNNSRGAFATFQAKNGYLYLSSAARKMIQDHFGEHNAVDIYYEPRNNSIVLIPNNDGEFTLNEKLCVRSIKDRIRDGRHDISIRKDTEGNPIVVIYCWE